MVTRGRHLSALVGLARPRDGPGCSEVTITALQGPTERIQFTEVVTAGEESELERFT